MWTKPLFLAYFGVLICTLSLLEAVQGKKPSGSGSQLEEDINNEIDGSGYGQLIVCRKDNAKFRPENELHYYGKPTPFVTTLSVGKNISSLVDPYRESALFHEYVLVGPGFATAKGTSEGGDGIYSESEEIIESEEELRLIIYDEYGLHLFERTVDAEKDLRKHNLAKQHAWALVNATGMLPSMTVSNTTFRKTFRFHANEGDKIAYHLSYPHLFRSLEPIPPLDVLIEFPANTKTLRTLKTMIDYQTVPLLRWRLSPARPVPYAKYTTLARRATTVTFHHECRSYFLNQLTTTENYFSTRYMNCIYQRRVQRIENPCLKDMFLVYVIVDYARSRLESTSQIMIAVPMVYNLVSNDSRGWINLTDVYCPSDLDPDECGEPSDVVLTNDHLIILTDLGLWVSASLNSSGANTSMPYRLKPLLKFTPIDPCAHLEDFNCAMGVGTSILKRTTIRRQRLFYTPICDLYQYPNYDDYLMYVVDYVTQAHDLSKEIDAFTVLYATKPYREWNVLFKGLHEYTTASGTLPMKELISIFFNHHRRLFDVTVLLNDNGRDRTFRFVLPEPKNLEEWKGYKSLNGLLGEGFLEYEFNSNFYLTHLQVNTETMDVFFLGNQMWIAESAGPFVYISLPVVYDHNGNESRLESCSFNHPDRSFVCSEKSHAEIYVGRIGTSYSPIAVEYRKISDFKYTSLYRFWPVPYLYYIGLTGHFIASYSGKIVLWFSPEYFFLFTTLQRLQETINELGADACQSPKEDESPIGCLLCKKLRTLNPPKCNLVDLQKFYNKAGDDFEVEPRFSFEMVAFNPATFTTRDTSAHGPLVPFPIDGDKGILFEAEVPDLVGYKPTRHYFNELNVGNKIVCHTTDSGINNSPVENRKSNLNCNEGRSTPVDCELYIRHMKSLKRKQEFIYLDGFRRALYVTIVKSFPVWPIPTELVILILKNSNKAIIQLDTSLFDTQSHTEFTFDYSNVGMTLYVPQHFSVLLVGFPEHKKNSFCNGTLNHDMTRMVGYATRYYRLGKRLQIKPFKAFLIKFTTKSFCDWYKKSFSQAKFEKCEFLSGDVTAMEYKARRDRMHDLRDKMLTHHIAIVNSVNSNLRLDLAKHNKKKDNRTIFQDMSPNTTTFSVLEDLQLKVDDPTIEPLKTTKLEINKTTMPYAGLLPHQFHCQKNVWNIIDGGCHLQLVLEDNLVIKQSGGRLSLDKHDSISFTMKLLALSALGKSMMHRPLIVVTNSNPDVLLVERKETIGSDPQTMQITLTPTGLRKGVASVTVRPFIVSTRCPFSDGSFTLIVQVHRAEGRRLHINYPVPVCKPLPNDGQYPRPWKVDLPSCVTRKELMKKAIIRRPNKATGDVFYSTLPVNYRPPSDKGTDIPRASNIYNVDPNQEKFKNWYRTSKETGDLKQCFGKRTRAECKCSENDMLSDDEKYSDCKRIVYTVKRGFSVDISVEYDRIMRNSDQHVEFFSPKHNWTVFVQEVNTRKEYTVSSMSNPYVEAVNSDQNLSKGKTFHDSRSLTVTPHGTGLFHFRVTLGSFDTFDEVTGYFMIYVPNNELNHVQLMIVMLLTITICMTFVFVGFLIVRKRLIAQLPFQVREKNQIKLD